MLIWGNGRPLSYRFFNALRNLSLYSLERWAVKPQDKPLPGCVQGLVKIALRPILTKVEVVPDVPVHEVELIGQTQSGKLTR